MMHFMVNGKSVELSSNPDDLLEQFMEQVRRQYNSDTALIASIRVDGQELDGSGEAALAGRKVSEVRSIEVFTAHPRELAEDTLQSLIEFTSHLESFSLQAAKSLEEGQGLEDLNKLIDGIQTFTEALVNTKQILRVGAHDQVNLLEADLVSILQDIADFQQRREIPHVIAMLREHLPSNLIEWRTDGLPALIRSRDS